MVADGSGVRWSIWSYGSAEPGRATRSARAWPLPRTRSKAGLAYAPADAAVGRLHAAKRRKRPRCRVVVDLMARTPTRGGRLEQLAAQLAAPTFVN